MRDEHFAPAVHARVTGKASNLSTSNFLLEFPVLGIKTRFETNDSALASAVQSAYGDWAGLRAFPELITARPPLRITLRGGPATHFLISPRANAYTELRVREPNLLYLRGAFIRAAADTQRGSAHAVLGKQLMQDPDRLRSEVLDALTLFLITASDRTPIHASAIADADVALALAGPSGVGKSTLARTAQANGYQVLSDDAVYVQLDPSPRIWGMARSPRPRAAGAALHEAKPAQPDAPLQMMPPARNWSGLCILQRSSASRPALNSLSSEEAFQLMNAGLDAGFDRFRAALRPSINALAQGGAWLLQLPDTPEATMPYLAEMMSAVRARRPA